jgi:pimeloyl-ACP methyl ester carboxylesterase
MPNHKRPFATLLRGAIFGVCRRKPWLAGCIAVAAAVCGGAVLAQPQDVAFMASVDGTEQFYMEILPASFTPTNKYDLMVGLHGHGSDRRQFATGVFAEANAFRAFAAQHGMIAITPDYRAKTSWMGPKAEADVVQIISELKSKYKINRVFVVGASMGGTSAATFAALHPELVAGATSMNGHANHLEYANFQEAIAESFGGAKATIPLEYKKRSAEYWPETLTMPIAFTTGGQDALVPPGSAIRLAGILKQLNRDVLLIHRPDGGHSTDYADAIAALEFMHGPRKPVRVAENTVSPVANANASVANWSNVETADNDAKGKVELGLKFSVEKAGKIKALRFYQAKSESGPHTFRLWGADGRQLLAVKAPAKSGSGWISVPLVEAFAVTPGKPYVVSYTCNTSYPATPDFFKTPIRRGDVTAIVGVYSFDALGEKGPDKVFKNMNYFLDVDFD